MSEPSSRAARAQDRWINKFGPQNFGVCTLADEKALDPDSVGTRGSEKSEPPVFPAR